MIFYLQKGATLFEIMLVLSIGGMLTLMSVRYYQSYSNAVQRSFLQQNVNKLLQAAANYYQTNCQLNSTNTSTALTNTPIAPLRLSIPALVSSGDLTNWNPTNSLVDATAVGTDSGYVLQLNPNISSSPEMVGACNVIQPGVACVPSATIALPANQATIVTWSIQVAVKLKNASKVSTYASIMSADCTSNMTGAVVDPCTPSSAGNYLVWRLNPSTAALQMSSPLQFNKPILKQFNLQYTHDQNYEMNSSLSGANAPAYYVCGG